MCDASECLLGKTDSRGSNAGNGFRWVGCFREKGAPQTNNCAPVFSPSSRDAIAERTPDFFSHFSIKFVSRDAKVQMSTTPCEASASPALPSWRRFVRVVGPYWWAHRRPIAASASCMSVAVVLQVALPMRCQRIARMPETAANPSLDVTVLALAGEVAVVVALDLVATAASLAAHYLAARSGHAVARDVTVDALAALNALSWEDAVAVPAAQRSVEVAKAAAFAAETTEGTLTNLLQSLLAGVGFTIAVLGISVPMTLMLFAIGLMSQLFSKWFRARYVIVDAAAVVRAEGAATALFCAALQRAETVRVWRAGASFLTNRFASAADGLAASRSALSWGVHSRGAVTGTVTNALFFCMIAVAAYCMAQGALHLGDVVFFFYSMYQLVRQLASLGHEGMKLATLSAQAACLCDLLDTGAACRSRDTTDEAKHARHHHLAAGVAVSLRNASVEYRSREGLSQDVGAAHPGGSLHAVTLTLHFGELVGVVGRSGCGKSTLLRLIAGLVAPSIGECSVATTSDGGQPVALLEQAPALLPGTLAENIRFGRPRRSAQESGLVDAEEERDMRRAAARAGCLEFIERLPRGFDTHVSDVDCARLSGGEQRRVCLARALYSDARVVLLDEPTAGLDPASVAKVMSAVAAMTAEGRAVVVVTHHLKLVKDASRVVAVGDGRVLGTGSLDFCRGLLGVSSAANDLDVDQALPSGGDAECD